MKILVWAITALNLYFGLNAFLNAIHVLHTSKYAQSTTVIFAILFLAMGAYGAYTAWTSDNLKLGLWIGLGPWLLALVVMFITMVTSSQQ